MISKPASLCLFTPHSRIYELKRAQWNVSIGIARITLKKHTETKDEPHRHMSRMNRGEIP